MARERRIIQTCTHCDKTGHNKRRCPEFSKAKKAVLFSAAEAVVAKTRRPNTCSLCQGVGHTKKDCQSVFTSVSLDNSEEEIDERETKAPVFVRVVHDAKASPHVVNLKKDKRAEQIKQLPAYEELKNNNQARKVLNVAEQVAKANEAYFAQRKKIAEEGVSMREIVEARKKHSEYAPPARVVVEESKPYDPKETIDSLMTYAKQWQNSVQYVGSLPKRARQSAVRAVLSIPKRVVVGAAVAMLAMYLPFPALAYYKNIKETGRQIVAESTSAFFSLQASTAAAFHANITQAQSDLSTALNSFDKADTLLEKDHKVLLYVVRALPIIGEQVASRQHLLDGGHHLALGNTHIVNGVDTVSKQPYASLTESFDKLREYFVAALPEYEAALVEFKNVDQKSIPAEYQQSFHDFQFLFTALIDDLHDAVDLSDAMKQLFGDDQFKRYLLVFQNQNELRPTGGFMGSYAVLDVQKGKILNLEIPKGGTYDVQGQLTEYVQPPLPLQVMNKRWEFQDANWWPDFPASAEKMAWFYQHSRGTTVDGVIAVNASVLERLLKVTGPINIPKKNVTVDSANVLAILQEDVESASNKIAPKAIIGEMLPVLTDKLAHAKAPELLALMTEMNAALAGKEVQIYSTDPLVADTMREFRWSGEVARVSEKQDYLMVVNANMHGEKSDAKIEQTIEHQAEVDEEGNITDTVIIRRKHTGVPGEKFYGVDNLSYVRVYVPDGAKLIEAGGFNTPPESYFNAPESWYKKDEHLSLREKEVGVDKATGTRIVKEFGKTSFGNWVLTKPGETSEAYLIYSLPFKIENTARPGLTEKTWGLLSKATRNQAARYSLTVQKQSGINSNFESIIIFPDAWVPVWKSDETMVLALNGATSQKKLDTDLSFGVVMEKKSARDENK